MLTRLAISSVLAATLAIGWVSAPLAQETPPPPGKMKNLSFPDFKEFTTENGMDVLVVEHKEQPVVTIYFLIEAGDAFDPDGKEALASFTAEEIRMGTTTRSSLELAEWIESVGGSVGGFTDKDFSAITVTVLSDYLDVAYEYLQDIILNATFPDDELELFRKRMKTALEFELSDPNAMAQRHLTNLIYGDHPYSKQPTVESLEAITRNDLVDFHKRNYVPNNVLVGVVGDVKWKDVRKAMETYFGEWQPGTPDQVQYTAAPEAPESKIYLYHKPGAVQTEIHIGHLAPKATDPDWPALTIASRILGQGFDSRLFMNIRETKGWTYRVRSSYTREKDAGFFRVFTPVRTEVTDSALVEVLSELERIRNEPVSAEELENAKSYLIGNFPITIETPDQIASKVSQYKLLGLGKEDLETYRDKLDAVTVEEVNRAMQAHLHPDHAYIVLVGDAMEIKDKVAHVASIETFDIAGEPLSLESLAVEPADYDYDTSILSNMKATYALTAQSMALGDLNVSLEKNQDGDEGVIKVSQSIAGMFSMDEEMSFRADDLSPISFKRTMQMGPQTLGSELAFTESGGTGTVQGPGAPEPKEVTFELVEGTILDSAIEYAISCLPIEAGKAYKFPVVDSNVGGLQTITVEVLELMDIETPAGSFAAFKVKVKRPEGDAFYYLGKDRPHILVKQEVPAQGVNIELKSLN